MSITQQLLTLVPAIYDAALDFNQWLPVLERLATAFDGHTASLFQRDMVEGNDQVFGYGYSPEILATYLRQFPAHNMFAARVLAIAPGTVETDRDVIEKDAFRRSEIYNNVMAKQLDTDSILTGLLRRQTDDVVAINVCRSMRAGDFDAKDKKAFRMLMPHLERSVAIATRLGTLHECIADGMALLDRAPCGAIVTDMSFRVLYANRPAEEMLQKGDGIAISAGGLRAATPALTARLRNIIAAAAQGDNGGAAALERPDNKGPIYAVASPVGTDFKLLQPGAHRVLLLVRDPLVMPNLPASYLQQLFGLTQAESGVAALLHKGLSLQQIAGKLGISSNTARVHLNAAMRKSGVHRQADLVGLLAGLPPVLVKSG